MHLSPTLGRPLAPLPSYGCRKKPRSLRGPSVASYAAKYRRGGVHEMRLPVPPGLLRERELRPSHGRALQEYHPRPSPRSRTRPAAPPSIPARLNLSAMQEQRCQWPTYTPADRSGIPRNESCHETPDRQPGLQTESSPDHLPQGKDEHSGTPLKSVQRLEATQRCPCDGSSRQQW